MNCPICNQELYNVLGKYLFACIYRNCPMSGLGYLHRNNFLQTRESAIANCIMIYKYDICNNKKELNQSLQELIKKEDLKKQEEKCQAK